MASGYPGTVTAAQVGSYFVGQYYQVLQKQRDLVHQFYTDASTMLRVDGTDSETAVGMLQIHNVIMGLNFTEIEIKTAHSLDSWNGGVLTIVSGSVQTKDYVGRRSFAQSFFLAPQEKGYFVLSDIFHFLVEEQIHDMVPHSQYDSTLDTSTSFPEPASDYLQSGETQARDFEDSANAEENDSADQYIHSEQQEQYYPEIDEVEAPTRAFEEIRLEEATPAYYNEVSSTVQEYAPTPVEEPVGEPPKKTYASILQVARGASGYPVAQPSVNKSVPPTSEWHQPQQPSQAYPSLRSGSERSNAAPVEEAAFEEGEGVSVYVRNLSSTVTESEIEQELKQFGRIKPDGVAIRVRQDIGVCYAFVEFEDITGAENAIQSSPILLNGRQIHVEERRPNPNGVSRGGRGRGSRGGRGGYQTEARGGGRYVGGRSYGRGNGQDGGDYYNRSSRGNGLHHRGGRQDGRGASSRGNGLNPLD
ncbi:hypothetical protein MKW94_001005 [Papaver nudicaule]|uniref:G3BP-like protein n=1 Tax=Papaver nudicaule TaxID=74823 RepID=A0AA41V8D2_PAPNU|nr:hypothetical protein [Papaver nudicaule]